MKKRVLALFLGISIFGLIGTASADWIAHAIAAPELVPEHAGLISLGASMVALAAVGRKRLNRSNHE